LAFRNLRQHLQPILDANPTGGIRPFDNAAFGAQPQGYGWRIDWQQSLMAAEIA
jgi:hypothetical protein